MEEKISERARNIPFSSIREVFDKAAKLEKEGVDIVHMEIGRPDFDTPQHIKEAAITALKDGQVHYTANTGILELRKEIANKLKNDNHITVDPENGVVVTVGCKEAVLDVILAYVNEGDEVIIPDPGWLEYQYIVKIAGGVPVPVTLKEEEDFLMSPADIEAKITSKTKLLLINSPHNPTGSVLSKSHLEKIADIAIRHNLIVVSDEIYEKLIYDDAEHISIASLPNMSEHTIVINGFSKAYSMDGWRLGYVAGEATLINPIKKMHQYNTSSATSFAQYGGVAAYKDDQKAVCEMVKSFDDRRKLIISRLKEMSGVDCVGPKGAFYVFPSFKTLNYSSKELAVLLLEEAQIACVPGSAFGDGGEGYIRLAYSTSYENIEKAMDRLELFLREKTKYNY